MQISIAMDRNNLKFNCLAECSGLKINGKNSGLETFFFAHGSIHSRGVAILIRKSFDFKLKSTRFDAEGRYLILEATIQDVPFLLVNISAPNTTTKQSLFFQTLSELIYGKGHRDTKSLTTKLY